MTRKRKHSRIHRQTRQNRSTMQPVISSQNLNLLNNFWKSICKNKMEQSSQDVDMVEMTDSEFSTIRKNSMYPHIPDKIRRDFESTEQQGILCKTKLKRGRDVAIYIAFPKSANNTHNNAGTQTQTQTQTQIYLNNIVAWLNFISEFASSQCS